MMNLNSRRQGISLLELLVTLIMVGLVVYAAVHLLYNTERNSILMRRHMDKLSNIQYCLDRIIEDLTVASAVNARLDIDEESLSDGRETCHLVISAEDTSAKAYDVSSIDWVAVPRYEQEDLLLFRREKTGAKDTGSNYIPLCENLCAFQVKKLDDTGEPVNSGPASMIEITARMFLDGPRSPDRVFTVSRTFCLDRFQL